MERFLKRCLLFYLGIFAVHARPKVSSGSSDVPQLYEGDIALTEEQVQALGKTRIHTASKSRDQEALTRAAIRNPRQLWPNGVIPFVINPSIDSEGRELIRNAMKNWEKHVCVHFKQREQEEGYVQFKNSRGCWSYLGYIGGPQEISVGRFTGDPPCDVGGLTHELGHTLGFFHEHSRPDRDDYVKILWHNIRSGGEGNFDKETTNVIDSRGVEYDYGSLMHYSRLQGNVRAGVATIQPKDPNADIGQRKGPSKLDIKQARLMYKCDEEATRNSGRKPEPAKPSEPSAGVTNRKPRPKPSPSGQPSFPSKGRKTNRRPFPGFPRPPPGWPNFPSRAGKRPRPNWPNWDNKINEDSVVVNGKVKSKHIDFPTKEPVKSSLWNSTGTNHVGSTLSTFSLI